MFEWARRLIAVVDREYDRRIRRASQVTAYGAGHHGHAAHDGDHGHPAEPGEDEAAEIVNVPPGTRIR